MIEKKRSFEDNRCQVVEEPGHRHAKPCQGRRAHHEIVVIDHDWEELPSGAFFWAECGCYAIREAQDNLDCLWIWYSRSKSRQKRDILSTLKKKPFVRRKSPL
jgi:hypothetical protein